MLQVEIGANIEKLSSGLKQAQSGLENFSGKVSNSIGRMFDDTDRLSSKFSNVFSDNNTKKVSENLDNLKNKIQTFSNESSKNLEYFGDKATDIGTKLSLAFSIPLGLLGSQAIKNAGSLESLEMGLKAVEEQQFGVGKSAEYAKLRLAEYIEIAKLPGLGLKESIGASINLRSVGFTAGEAKRSILAFANTLALVGKGKNELAGVNIQLTQLAGKTSGFGADLRIIREYAPQVGGALQKAFGTIDTEKIAKMGFNGKQVIDKIITELEKLPKAGDGIINTFENVSDAIFNSLGRVGLALNKAFDIKGIFNNFADFVTRLADSFSNLSPFIQKALGVIAILAVTLPPILVTIGLMIPAITALAGVFAGVTAPILGIGLTIGALVYIVYKNWDTIVQKLSDWGFLDQIKNTFNSFVGFLKSGFDLIKKVVGGTWNYFSDTLVPVLDGIFSKVVIIVRSAFGVLDGIFKIFKGILTLSWSSIWDGLKEIVSNVFIALFVTVYKLVGFIGTLVGKFFKMISGNDTLLKWATDLEKSGLLLSKVNKEIDKTNSKKVAPNGTPDKVTNTTTLTEEQLNAIKKYNEKSIELYEKANVLRQENYANSLKNELQKSIALEESKYTAKKNEVNKEVADQRAKNALLSQLEIEHQTELKKIRESYKPIQAISGGGIELGGIGSVLQGGDSAFGKVGAVNNRQSIISSMIQRLQNDIPRLKEVFAKIGLTATTETEKLRNRTIIAFSQFNPSMTQKVMDILMNLNQRIGETLLQGASNAFVGIGNIAGQMIAGTANIADAGNMILGVIGTVFSQMGEQFISAGVAMSGLYALLSNPFTSAPALIAVGVALSALGGAISATVSNTGKGGSGYSPNYSSGGGVSPSMSSVSQQQMRLTINLSGELTAKGNNLVALINKTQKEVVRTRS